MLLKNVIFFCDDNKTYLTNAWILRQRETMKSQEARYNLEKSKVNFITLKSKRIFIHPFNKFNKISAKEHF